MSEPVFAVNRNGLTASVDDLALIVAAVSAYFALPARGITTPIPVLAGDWETYRNGNQGAPGAVIIARASFQMVEASGGAAFPTGLRYSPGIGILVDATHAAFVVGVRAQTYQVWVHGLPEDGANFTTTAPGSTYALAAQTVATALCDLTFSALRDVHSHLLGSTPWKPLGPERGEFAYGSAFVGGFGPIPIPILGDVYEYAPAQQFSGTNLIAPATTGDVITAP